jgi:hypothetical protein
MKRQAEEMGQHRPHTPTHDCLSDYVTAYTKVCACIPIRQSKNMRRQETTQEPIGDTCPDDLAPPTLPDTLRVINT